jgi:molybdopterin converting factor small subunit
MNITVKTFASVSDICGFREKVYAVPEGSSVSAVLDIIVSENPGLGRLKTRLLSAVNEEHSPGTRLLSGNDVVAFFPPVSGG